GGMIHEALNNCEKDLRLIVILNENEMSISPNIGRFAKTLSRLRTSKQYFRTKRVTRNAISRIPLIGQPLFRAVRSVKQTVKNMLYRSNYFEDLGFYYLGPVDGHDIEALESVLLEAKDAKQSVIIHVKTKKGKGYAPAEENPSHYHAVAPAGRTHTDTNFSAELGRCLCELAEENPSICAITAAMSYGTGLEAFAQKYPDHFFDVGIAEEHAVTFAAGLAANQMRPVFAVYSSFLQRAYDNVIHDVALQQLPVMFCVDRAGLNAGDGATHHGIFDVAYLGQIPGMTIYTPASFSALRAAVREGLAAPGPVAIRYPNSGENAAILDAFYRSESVPVPGARVNYDDPETLDAVIITHGRIAAEALAASDLLRERGINCGIILLELIKPFDRAAAQIAAHLPRRAGVVLFLEEEIRAGGMGMLLSDALRQNPDMQNKTVRILAVDDNFAHRTANLPVWTAAGLDRTAIVAEITANLP
ncbi:MAG: 1-deoxy-D-xylulose-5-phosphate synthase, partial [Clostridia bacterium]|nr:1-deoxy-D-xylulose-5-phosphate synthase [Clostridia bacterium]